MKRPSFHALFIGLVALVMVVMVGLAIHREVVHPCIRFGTTTCKRDVCTWKVNPMLPEWHPDQHCLSWRTEHYPCQVCTERKP